MLQPKFYTLENVERARYAQYAMTALTILVCGYLIITTSLGTREVWKAESGLRKAKTELANFSRSVSEMKKQEETTKPIYASSIENFAVHISEWARSSGIAIESIIPEGSPVSTNVNIDGANLGCWNANRVRVKGSGDFLPLMIMLDRFHDPGMPVKLESFAFQSNGSSERSAISFDILVTVYEKATGAT